MRNRKDQNDILFDIFVVIYVVLLIITILGITNVIAVQFVNLLVSTFLSVSLANSLIKNADLY